MQRILRVVKNRMLWGGRVDDDTFKGEEKRLEWMGVALVCAGMCDEAPQNVSIVRHLQSIERRELVFLFGRVSCASR